MLLAIICLYLIIGMVITATNVVAESVIAVLLSITFWPIVMIFHLFFIISSFNVRNNDRNRKE